MAANKPAPQQLRTLTETHNALVRIRPSREAPLEAWQTYYHRSAVLYAEIAEIDRGHHHEALYWAERELQKAMLVTGAIQKGAKFWNPWTESALYPGRKEVDGDEGI
ncbi:MAG TPA: AMED_5909 family protein [Pseudonocardiaceae bacterium]|jgi:hypothetical protein|nr:AMED_5909 family protein [Pseudonocardiaceae bacterium]